MTDVFDDFLYRDTVVYGPDGAPEACPPGSHFKGRYVRSLEGLRVQPASERLLEWARERSRLIDLVSVAATKLRGTTYGGRGKSAGDRAQRGPAGAARLVRRDWSGETQTLVEKSMQTLRATLRLARSANIRIGVTAVPHLGHFTGLYSQRPFEAIEAACRAEGVAYLDSFGGIREQLGAVDPATLYIAGDMHFARAATPDGQWPRLRSFVGLAGLEAGVQPDAPGAYGSGGLPNP